MTLTRSDQTRPIDAATQDACDVEAAYREYSARCYVVALRVVGDRHLAYDVVQEVFASLVREPDRFDPTRGALSTWLVTITHHKAIDLIRWRRTRTARDEAHRVDRDFVDVMPNPEEAMCLSDERARVRAALPVLKPVERSVILFAYFAGYSQAEIAARLGIPLGTVKSRTLSGMHRLRQQLERDSTEYQSPAARQSAPVANGSAVRDSRRPCRRCAPAWQ